MNSNYRLARLIIVVLLLAGCASQATLRIRSEPEGAYIIDPRGRSLGMAPVYLNYDFADDTNRCFEASGYQARWASGAVTELEPVLLCEIGEYDALVQRGFNQPGLNEDMQVAIQLRMLQAQQMQARAAYAAAQAAQQSARLAEEAAYAARRAAYDRQQQERHFHEAERRDSNAHGVKHSDERGEQGNSMPMPLENGRGRGRDQQESAGEQGLTETSPRQEQKIDQPVVLQQPQVNEAAQQSALQEEQAQIRAEQARTMAEQAERNREAQAAEAEEAARVATAQAASGRGPE